MSDLEDRTRQWVRDQLAAIAGAPPRYGSSAWWDETDRHRQWMGILVAGECWRQESLPAAIALRMTAELQVRREVEEEHWAALHAEAQRVVRSIRSQPGIGLTYDERRTRELARAVEVRPGDFAGRAPLRRTDGAA